MIYEVIIILLKTFPICRYQPFFFYLPILLHLFCFSFFTLYYTCIISSFFVAVSIFLAYSFLSLFVVLLLSSFSFYFTAPRCLPTASSAALDGTSTGCSCHSCRNFVFVQPSVFFLSALMNKLFLCPVYSSSPNFCLLLCNSLLFSAHFCFLNIPIGQSCCFVSCDLCSYFFFSSSKCVDIHNYASLKAVITYLCSYPNIIL